VTGAATAEVQDAYGASIRGAHVRLRVQGDGEPLLLLNGTTRPLESWEPFVRALPGRRLISVDLPGVGLSPTPVLPMTMAGLARVAAGVLDEVDVTGPCDVLGFSFGGAVAQQLAVQSPDRVRRLVLASTSCGIGATPGTRDALGSMARPVGAAWPLPDLVGTTYQFLAITTWSSIPFLGALRAPTLVVTGSRDRVVPPDNSRLLARRIPGARLAVIDGAGHDLQRDSLASHLARTVEEFLTTSSPTRTTRSSTTDGDRRRSPAPAEKVGTQ